jgi:glutathione gamma-glutamylcysteinyltransferase
MNNCAVATCRAVAATDGIQPGIYRRPLPEGLIAFSSPAGRSLFREALLAGGMEGYFPLAEQFQTQVEPTYCGISSLVMVLNALEVDPKRLWKGVWRWFSEDIADCCDQLSSIQAEGVSLEGLARLAHCNGVTVEVTHAEHSSLVQFRALVQEVCSDENKQALIASYSRQALGQTGEGHFSPIGGYHAAKDLVLLMDVARFKYPPHWVPLSLLWSAMESLDSVTGKTRGYLRVVR